MLPLADARAGYPASLRSAADLIGELTEADLAAPTRCAGWTVADLAAHLAGGITDVATGRLEGAGTPEWTSRQVEERRGRSAAELADEIAGGAKLAADLLGAFDEAAWSGPAPAGYDGPLGDGVGAIWYDSALHQDDIRHALGRPPAMAPADVLASVDHVAVVLSSQGWGPAVLALDGLPEIVVGNGAEGARRVDGDPVAFLLAATGRGDPAGLGLDPSVNIYR